MYRLSKNAGGSGASSGFSLVEIMVVVAIFSLLASIAIPGYTSFIQQSRRDDARHLLLLNAQRLQRCFTLEGVYNGSCVTRADSEGGYYKLSDSSQLETASFTLIAVPVAGSSQESDSACGSFSYDHTGSRSATGTQHDKCW